MVENPRSFLAETFFAAPVTRSLLPAIRACPPILYPGMSVNKTSFFIIIHRLSQILSVYNATPKENVIRCTIRRGDQHFVLLGHRSFPSSSYSQPLNPFSWPQSRMTMSGYSPRLVTLRFATMAATHWLSC
jgi:hypothetical protein